MTLFASLSFIPLLMLAFFFFNDTATTEIYTLSLHDALPIWGVVALLARLYRHQPCTVEVAVQRGHGTDRKSTRLNSSHLVISYAVFCLKKKTRVICASCTRDCIKRSPQRTPHRQATSITIGG